jgi:hypothetical protein
VLAAAHLDHDPRNNRLRNLKSLCQRCHMIHDRPHHLAQRRITYLLRRALGDLFLGPYSVWFKLQPRAEAIGRDARKHNRIDPQINRGLAYRRRMSRAIRREHQPQQPRVAESEIMATPVGMLS